MSPLRAHKIISPDTRIPSYPLAKWEDIVRPIGLEDFKEETGETWCLANNNLALICLHQKKIEEAHFICIRQVDCLARNIRNIYDKSKFLTLALQPIINLARLDFYSNKYSSKHFYLEISELAALANNRNSQNVALNCSSLFLEKFGKFLAHFDPYNEVFLRGIIARHMAQSALKNNDHELLEKAFENSSDQLLNEIEIIRQLTQPLQKKSNSICSTTEKWLILFHNLCTKNGGADVLVEPALAYVNAFIDIAIFNSDIRFLRLSHDIIEQLCKHHDIKNELKELSEKCLLIASTIEDEFEIKRALVFCFLSSGNDIHLKNLLKLEKSTQYENLRNEIRLFVTDF